MQLVKKHKSTTFSVNDCLPIPTYIIISFMHEVCAAKNMSFRILVVLIPMKRRIGGQGIANPSFSMTTTKVLIVLKDTYGGVARNIICSHHRLYCIVGVIPKEGLAGPCLQILLLL